MVFIFLLLSVQNKPFPERRGRAGVERDLAGVTDPERVVFSGWSVGDGEGPSLKSADETCRGKANGRIPP